MENNGKWSTFTLGLFNLCIGFIKYFITSFTQPALLIISVHPVFPLMTRFISTIKRQWTHQLAVWSSASRRGLRHVDRPGIEPPTFPSGWETTTPQAEPFPGNVCFSTWNWNFLIVCFALQKNASYYQRDTMRSIYHSQCFFWHSGEYTLAGY